MWPSYLGDLEIRGDFEWGGGLGGLSFNEVVHLIPVILWRSQTECYYIIIIFAVKA